MESYIDRMIVEHRELCDRISKLAQFIRSKKCDALNAENQNLLWAQLYAMKTYRAILTRRIRINKTDGEEK